MSTVRSPNAAEKAIVCSGSTQRMTEILNQSTLQNISFDSQLAKGGFGTVFRGTLDKQVFAIKRIRENKSAWREVETLDKTNKLKMSYVVKYYGYYLQSIDNYRFVNIVMEYMPQGDLDSYISNPDIDLTEKDYTVLLHDAALGLSNLHESDIIHCDIKSRNILLYKNKNRNLHAKVGDLGSAVHVSVLKNSETGTWQWMAPEVLLDKFSHSKLSDVYSLGLVIVECITRSHPRSKYPDAIGYLIDKNLVGYNDNCAPNASRFFQQILDKCLDDDPALRPEAKELAEKLSQNLTTLSKNG